MVNSEQVYFCVKKVEWQGIRIFFYCALKKIEG